MSEIICLDESFLDKAPEELTWEESFELIRLYVSTIREDDVLAEMILSSKVYRLMELSQFTSPAHFEAILLPVLTWVGVPNPILMERPVITRLLRSWQCPLHLLSIACHSPHTAYAYFASRNALCPVEDAVYAALTHGGEW